MKQSIILKEEDDKETKRIIELLEFFSTRGRTFQGWLNETQKQKSDEEPYFNMLISSGFLFIPQIKETTSYISLFNEYSNRFIFVTKDGYSFLNSYKFNKQSLKINEEVLLVSKHVKLISIAAIIIAFISLIISLAK